MAYCGPAAIPYMWFLGLSKRQVWDDTSRAAAIAWQLDRDGRCNECGQRVTDWLDADGDPLRIPPADVVKVTCPGCESLDMARDDQGDEKLRPGQRFAFRTLVASGPGDDADLTVGG